MAAFSPNTQASLGSLNVSPFWKLPNLPNIIPEWAAIIPLVCHLASHRRDYRTTGEIALSGRISLGLFPKLGTLAGLSRLLRRGPGFLDEASTRGGATSTVWDVRWGSVFPCANGAARDLVEDYIQHRGARHITTMPETLPNANIERKGSSPDDSVAELRESAMTDSPRKTRFRRYQILDILRLRFAKHRTNRKSKLSSRAEQVVSIFTSVALLVLAILLGLCGAYGTATLTGSSAISYIVAQNVVVLRPPGYLESNESSDNTCMLVAPHQNAQSWTVFVGERGIIDTLLNKTMIMLPECKSNKIASTWFYAAHLLQLLTMTFVAGQKGWDGVMLTALMLVDLIFRWHFRGTALAKVWLTSSGVSAEARSYQFGSRMVMLGTIEKLGGCRRTVWMDQIIPGSSRRDAWLNALFNEAVDESSVASSDAQWVRLSATLATVSAEIIERESMKQDV